MLLNSFKSQPSLPIVTDDRHCSHSNIWEGHKFSIPALWGRTTKYLPFVLQRWSTSVRGAIFQTVIWEAKCVPTHKLAPRLWSGSVLKLAPCRIEGFPDMKTCHLSMVGTLHVKPKERWNVGVWLIYMSYNLCASPLIKIWLGHQVPKLLWGSPVCHLGPTTWASLECHEPAWCNYM